MLGLEPREVEQVRSRCAKPHGLPLELRRRTGAPPAGRRRPCRGASRPRRGSRPRASSARATRSPRSRVGRRRAPCVGHVPDHDEDRAVVLDGSGHGAEPPRRGPTSTSTIDVRRRSAVARAFRGAAIGGGLASRSPGVRRGVGSAAAFANRPGGRAVEEEHALLHRVQDQVLHAPSLEGRDLTPSRAPARSRPPPRRVAAAACDLRAHAPRRQCRDGDQQRADDRGDPSPRLEGGVDRRPRRRRRTRVRLASGSGTFTWRSPRGQRSRSPRLPTVAPMAPARRRTNGCGTGSAGRPDGRPGRSR